MNRALSQLSTILELSGNPIAVLENVTEAQDIAVQPGAVWELPEQARAYLLDLLQGGGVQLHIDYVNLVTSGISHHPVRDDCLSSLGPDALVPALRYRDSPQHRSR